MQRYSQPNPTLLLGTGRAVPQRIAAFTFSDAHETCSVAHLLSDTDSQSANFLARPVKDQGYGLICNEITAPAVPIVTITRPNRNRLVVGSTKGQAGLYTAASKKEIAEYALRKREGR